MSAQRKLDNLRARVLDGDATVTAAQLAEAHAAVELEGLQAEARRRRAADPETTRRQARVDAGTERRRRAKAQAKAEERESWRRAIRRGLDRDTVLDLRENPHRYPPEYVELWREMTNERTPA